MRRRASWGWELPDSRFIQEMIAGAKSHIPSPGAAVCGRNHAALAGDHDSGNLYRMPGTRCGSAVLRSLSPRLPKGRHRPGRCPENQYPRPVLQREAGGISLRTPTDTFYGERVIVSAGAWVGKLLADLSLPLTPVRKTVGWFRCDEGLYDSRRFPAFFFDLPDEQYYGFPSFGGSGVKVGRHDGGPPIDPDRFDRTFGGASGG